MKKERPLERYTKKTIKNVMTDEKEDPDTLSSRPCVVVCGGEKKRPK